MFDSYGTVGAFQAISFLHLEYQIHLRCHRPYQARLLAAEVQVSSLSGRLLYRGFPRRYRQLLLSHLLLAHQPSSSSAFEVYLQLLAPLLRTRP